MIRLVRPDELAGLLELYTHLHNNTVPDDLPETLWREIMCDPNHNIIVAEQDSLLVSSCVLIIVPNLTHHRRPYALIENVVTHAAYRKQGYASAVLDYAKEIARQRNCYKIMLMTGSKEESTLRFYERAGYNRQDKTGFIQWLK